MPTVVMSGFILVIMTRVLPWSISASGLGSIACVRAAVNDRSQKTKLTGFPAYFRLPVVE
jgi:hypothetical protein